MAVKRSIPFWGKVLWGLGILASLSLALWMLLPGMASLFVERQLAAFGCKHVNVEIERPGLRRTVVPLVSFQKDLGPETAHLTIRGLTLDYELARLQEGFLDEARIEALHLELRGGPGAQSEPAPGEPLLATVAAILDSVSEFLLHPRAGRFALTNASIFRERATGPFQRLKVSGTLRHETKTLTGAITFQGTKGAPYALQLTMNPHGRTTVLLHSGKDPAESLLDIEFTVQASQALHWQGSLKANLKRATPFLALLLPLGPDLERVDGVVEFQGDGSTRQIESFDRLLRDASTRVHGAFQASVELPAWGENSENVAGTLSGEVDADATGVAVTLFPPSFVKGLVRPPANLLKGTSFLMPLKEKGAVHLQLQDTVNARIASGDDPHWYLDGPIRVQYSAKPAPVGLDVVVTSASGPFRDPLSTKADVHGRLWGTLPAIESGPVHVKDLRWDVTGTLAFQKPAIRAEVEKGSWVKTGPLQFEQGTANLTEFYVGRTFPVSVEWSSKIWKVGPTTTRVMLPRLDWGGHTVALEGVGLRLQEASGQGKQWQTTGTARVRRPRLDWGGRIVTMERVGLHVQKAWGNGNEWQTTGMVKLLGLSSELDEFVPPEINLAMQFDAAPALVKANILAETVDQSVKAAGRVTHDVSTNRGSLRATLVPRPFSPSGTTLSRLITPWEHPFDVTAGRLALSAAVTWGAGPRRVSTGSDERQKPGSIMVQQGRVAIMAEDLDGYYEDIPVEDVNATITVTATSLDDVTMAGPATVRIGRVDPGIPLENIALTLRLGRLGFGDGVGQPSVDLTDVSARTLGGRISSPRIHFDSVRPSTRFTLNVDGVQLDRLLQLEQQQGLEGSGVLDGNIPITLNGKTVTVHEGHLAVRPPGGVIRFAPVEETKQMLVLAKPEMALILRALENFRYDVLRAAVNYREDGTLVLATRLEGKNPDMKEAPPVHFNLNVEENIPALLRSVQVVKDIENRLEKVFGQP